MKKTLSDEIFEKSVLVDDIKQSIKELKEEFRKGFGNDFLAYKISIEIIDKKFGSKLI